MIQKEILPEEKVAEKKSRGKWKEKNANFKWILWKKRKKGEIILRFGKIKRKPKNYWRQS